MSPPCALLGHPGFQNCTPGEYNTSRVKRRTYEGGGIVVVSPMPAYLIDLSVKISSLASFPTNGMIYVIDMALGQSFVQASYTTIAQVYDAGGSSLAISDGKLAGGLFGYGPPTEWQVQVPGKGILQLGRKFTMGIGVAVVDPSGEAIATTASLISVDARFVFLPGMGCP